ncbi:MAG: hypothetical protein D6734_05085 [Candidatus Schekmanbacteria bacterium]|nr:MAG: hypothetical protein D6734_05085 [Candidatus Schekmanbacteria bacterium]
MKINNDRGIAYAALLIMLLTISLLSMSYVYISTMESESQESLEDASKSYYYAEAGLRKALWLMLRKPFFADANNGIVFTENFEEGSFKYTINKALYNESVFIKATGIFNGASSEIITHAYIRWIIKTYAGNGSNTYNGEGIPAVDAGLDTPTDVSCDLAGNIYIAVQKQHRVRMVSKTTGKIVTVAGTGTAGYNGDGIPAVSAMLNKVEGVYVDNSGNIYICDTMNHRIRKVDSSGIITTIAGTGSPGDDDGEVATLAKIDQPVDIILDSAGNIYFADIQNDKIKKIDAVTGIIDTIAGTGNAGYSGDGGPAISAKLKDPSGIALDSTGNLYIADSSNNRIRKVDLTTGIITTVAGIGSGGYSGDGGPAVAAKIKTPSGIWFSSEGYMLIADTGNQCIRVVDPTTGIISTYAGIPTHGGFAGDGGPPKYAKFSSPHTLDGNNEGSIFIVDTANNRIRVITIN